MYHVEGRSGYRATAVVALLAGASVVALSAQVHAQEVALEGIVIEGATLSGEPTDPATIGSATTVITGEELERRQIRNAAEALRTVPGVAVNRTGGAGGLTQIRIRGTEGNHVKVVIDGVEMNSLDFGEFDFSTLLATDIERIEVIRGPQSGIYGANALSGVINIVTKKGGAPRVSVTAEGGSLKTSYLAANASGGTERGYFSVSAARRETDGFNFARSGSEDDGSEQKALFARGGWAPTDYFRIDVMGRLQENDTAIDSDSPFDGVLDDVPDRNNLREQKLARISAEIDTFSRQWSHKFFADHLSDDFFDKTRGVTTSKNDGERNRVGYQSVFRFDSRSFVAANHTLVGLVERIDETFNNESAFGSVDASRRTNAAAGEYRGVFNDSFFITGNLRFDDKDRFEDATTYRVAGAYIWRFTGTRFHASYGKGITDPTFFEQFGSSDSFVGNPDLKPEEAIGWDVGIEQKFWSDRLRFDVTYFRSDLTNEILTTFDFGTSQSSVINIDGDSERQGVEVTIAAQLTSALLLTGSYTYLDAEQPISPFFPNPPGTFPEIRRPKHSGSINASYSFLGGNGRVDATLIYNGEMKDGNFGTGALVTLDDYVLVNVAASYKLTDRLEFFGRVENLFDEDYEEVFSYASAPVAAYAGLRITLGSDEPPLE